MKQLVEINAENYLPSNLAAERSILGGIMLNNDAFNEAAGAIKSDDFTVDAHRRIFKSMGVLVEGSKPVDMITLVEELSRSHDLEPVGGVPYISELAVGVPDRPSIEHYVRIVKEKAQLRSLLVAAKLTIERIVTGEQPQEVAAGLLEAVLDVETQSAKSRSVLPAEFMPDVVRSLEQQSASHGLIGLSTGLEVLDNAIGGLRPGELIVVGARPGAGKTALAAQIGEANAEKGIAVGMFSLEMSRWDLGRRFISMMSNVAATLIRDPRFIPAKGQEWTTIARASAEISKWPLHVDDNGSLTIAEIIARAKLFIARSQAKLIIVDYLQLIRAVGISEIRERVGHVADQLRILAKSEQVPVVLLSQLRRPERINDEPTLLELKESGDIEAHAHVVLLIHSPLGDDGRPTGQQKIIVAKNRNGLRGQTLVTLSEAKLKFFARMK